MTTSRGTYVADPAAGSPPQLQDVPDRPRTQKPLFLLCSATPGMSLGSCIVTRNGVTGHRAGDLGVVRVHGQRIRDSRQCVHESMTATCCVKMVLMKLEEHQAEVELKSREDIPRVCDRHTRRILAESCFRPDTRRVKYLGNAAVNVRLLLPMSGGDTIS